MPAERLIQQRYQTDNPAVKCGIVDGETALHHHLFEVAQAEGAGQISAGECRRLKDFWIRDMVREHYKKAVCYPTTS